MSGMNGKRRKALHTKELKNGRTILGVMLREYRDRLQIDGTTIGNHFDKSSTWCAYLERQGLAASMIKIFEWLGSLEDNPLGLNQILSEQKARRERMHAQETLAPEPEQITTPEPEPTMGDLMNAIMGMGQRLNALEDTVKGDARN